MDRILDALARLAVKVDACSEASEHAAVNAFAAYATSFRRNVDANLAYVAVSRARKHAAIYTDDRDRLASAIEGRDGAKVGAIDETLTRKGAAIAIPVPVRTMGVAIG